ARLEEILDQIGGETPPARSAAPATEPPPAPTEAPAIPREKDFLEELDRVIASTEPAEEEEPDTRPPPGVKCPDCGYMNDANAWYCGVCGVDLA
ncbi:MAG TPA: zinc ribbon domain-containing protein, partial [Longimicrobiaceae bacterium]|nr:zinc ribbon domain-containing protein [Longimicrobiaceae bacterium]